jgi:hypothetical protein
MKMTAFWDIVSEYTDVSEVPTAFIMRIITLMMEAVYISETTVYSETTRRYIPEGSYLRIVFVVYFTTLFR